MLAFAASIIACIFPATLVAEDWYRWRGPDLNGISSETDWKAEWPSGKLPIAWTIDVGTGFSSVVVQDNRVYTLGHVDDHAVVYCVDASDGHVIWKHAYPASLDARDFEGGPTTTPTIDGDRLYVLSRAGALFCFDNQSGEVRWQKQIADVAEVRLPGWGFAAAPLVVGDKLVLTLGESGAVVNKHNGDLIWSSPDRECGYASPVPIHETHTVVFPSGRSFTGVDLETGQPQWSLRWLTSFGCNAADPIIHDGKMFLCSGYNRGAALFQLTDDEPELIWKNKNMLNQLHGSLLYDGHLYGIDGDMEAGARLTCLSWETGEVVWSEDELKPGGLSLADGKLIVLTEVGELVLAPATPNGFHEISRAKVLDGKCWTVPVLSSGRVFCRSIQGQVACVDLRD
ncbi:secreted protein [Rhodopirellula maiorica SM1]|uniref:Secreted protein n=2 Tax=Novipirellula TaxID=2795426 RepID=M5RZI9_9BACT|nr:secreted protein [Rhodopirellula maiorica SM1]